MDAAIAHERIDRGGVFHVDDGGSAPVTEDVRIHAPVRERLHVVIAGHVDHGKSTVIGRLLADTGSLPEGKLDAVRALCERTSRPFEYAFLLDALKGEQAQGITIDTARVFFKSALRDYVILDAPGHVEFLKNMVTGASRAEAALLIIDAKEGVQENSRRHGYLMSMLGIKQVAVVVNKMDLVGYDEAVFNRLRDEYTRFLDDVGLRPTCFVPVAAREGANIAFPTNRLSWYHGPTALGVLDSFVSGGSGSDKPFRMPVQGVYKFTEDGDTRRIIAGTVETGTAAVGDEVVFYPSGKRSRIKSIEGFNTDRQDVACAGTATGFTLHDQIYVTRGEVASLVTETMPLVTTLIRTSLFWMGKQPLERGKDYLLKLGTARVPMRVEKIVRVLDAATLATTDDKDRVDRHDVAECVLRLGRPIALDPADLLPATGRFVIVDDFEIRGGGIVRAAEPDGQTSARDAVRRRNNKWDSSFISAASRADRYRQCPALVLITGPRDADRKGLAKELEARLFDEGRLVYFLGMGNILCGLDADLQPGAGSRLEHLRRLGEIANIMLDAGLILLVSAVELTTEEVQLVSTSVSPHQVITAWLGEPAAPLLSADLFLDASGDVDECADRLRQRLRDTAVTAAS